MTTLFFLLLWGCAAHRKPAAAEVVVSRECIKDVKPSDAMECRGPDMEHMKCTGIVITKGVGCETVSVRPKNKTGAGPHQGDAVPQGETQ